MHQDTAYVVTSSPLELAAAWIALEDVTPGSGELMYYRGSHRLPEYAFAGERKHWDAERDGEAPHAAWPPRSSPTRRRWASSARSSCRPRATR